jgi:hypothetical protein
MPETPVTFQPTPNPNALKCLVGRTISDRPRSFFNAAEAQGDPLGRELFAIPGVTNVLIQDSWLTVCKKPDADWASIRAGVERVLRESKGA